MKKDNIEYFEWGKIEWIIEPSRKNPSSIMSVGIATNFPGKLQPRHVHYADEQLLYVISGEGAHKVNGKLVKEEPGSIHHIRAGSTHELVHVGNEPLVKLLVSIPIHSVQNLLFQNNSIKFDPGQSRIEDNIKISKQDIKKIYKKTISLRKMPITILDLDGQIVIGGENYPSICMQTCKILDGISNCSVYNIEYDYRLFKEPLKFKCSYGLTVFIVPIVIKDEVIGLIKGGHVKESNDIIEESIIDNNTNYVSYETPKSSVNAIQQILKNLSNSIASYYIFKNTVTELSKKEEIIKDISNNELNLESSLRATKERILSIQINNHFLFNTLNNIASLALEENSDKIYNSIISLSKMFRYILRNKDYFVQVKEEISYIKNYIELQKIKYGDKLKVKFDISLDTLDVQVPFNCLQPIIENCFKHGFNNKDTKIYINILVGLRNDKLYIEITDNGAGMEKETLRMLDFQIAQDMNFESNGLKMIYSKLQYFYDTQFNFTIDSAPGKGTTVQMILPKKI